MKVCTQVIPQSLQSPAGPLERVLLETKLRHIRHCHETTNKEGAKSIVEGGDDEGRGVRRARGKRHAGPGENATGVEVDNNKAKEGFMSKGRGY